MPASVMPPPPARADACDPAAARYAGPALKTADAHQAPPPTVECSAIGRRVSELVNGSAPAAAELLACLLDTIRCDVKALRAAYEGKQWGDLRAVAHRIKGTAQLSGTASLVAICQQVEAWADQQNALALLSVQAAFSASVQRLTLALAALAARPPEQSPVGQAPVG